MSFILDALKKSEHKRRAQAGIETPAIFEPPSPSLSVSRRWIIILVVLLLLCVLLLAALLLQPSPVSPVAPEQSLATVAETAPVPAPLPSQAPAVVSPPVAAERPPEVEESPGLGLEQRPEPTTSVPSSSAVETKGQVYSISDLPADVRRRLPALQMALHAYNATDTQASLVQINGQLVREGAQIAEDLSIDEITHAGAVLRSGSYRFLLPRRGQ